MSEADQINGFRAGYEAGRAQGIMDMLAIHERLHQSYGSTSACRGGIGGQTMTGHCGVMCGGPAHDRDMDALFALAKEAAIRKAES